VSWKERTQVQGRRAANSLVLFLAAVRHDCKFLLLCDFLNKRRRSSLVSVIEDIPVDPALQGTKGLDIPIASSLSGNLQSPSSSLSALGSSELDVSLLSGITATDQDTSLMPSEYRNSPSVVNSPNPNNFSHAPQRCRHPHCVTGKFLSLGGYRKHILVEQGVEDVTETLLLIWPAPEDDVADQRFERQQCSHPGCTSTVWFEQEGMYRTYAQRVHGAYTEDLFQLLNRSGIDTDGDANIDTVLTS
jgi:hypothetical protein